MDFSTVITKDTYVDFINQHRRLRGCLRPAFPQTMMHLNADNSNTESIEMLLLEVVLLKIIEAKKWGNLKRIASYLTIIFGNMDYFTGL